MVIRGRPVSLWLLLLLLGQLSIRALLGGGALLTAPAGTLVGLSTDPLDGIPVSDFLLPGLVLVLVFGLGPASVCYGLYTNRWWAWPAAVTVALALLLWVAVEIGVGFSRPTIYLNLGTAIAIAGVALHPAVRRHLQRFRGGASGPKERPKRSEGSE